MKNLIVTHGPQSNPLTVHVQLLGVLETTPLTPAIARQAARIACGHERGVRVMDGDNGYILYSEKQNSHRKFEMDSDDGDVCPNPECNSTGDDLTEHEFTAQRTLHCLKCGEEWEVVAR